MHSKIIQDDSSKTGRWTNLMNQKELNGMVGKALTIRRATHLCLSLGRDALLLPQLAKRDKARFSKGGLAQHIAAHSPHGDRDKLVWRQGGTAHCCVSVLSVKEGRSDGGDCAKCGAM